jgi:hypothetical protein
MNHSRFRRPLGWVTAALLVVTLFPFGGTRAKESGQKKPDREGKEGVPAKLAPPVTKGPWIVPAPGKASEPVWGVKGGIAVGLWPTPGPRGLLRVYTPYLGQPRLRMINFIAVEPVVGKARGLSELEPSPLDNVAGKAMWTGNALEREPKPRRPWEPAAGKEVKVGGRAALTVFVFVEPFRNGARPVVQLTFRRDRPREVGLKAFAARGSAPMKACVLTATMGNYARLRRLWLRGQVVDARKAWPAFRADRWGFAPPRQWPAARLLTVGKEVTVAATPDEANPARAAYGKQVPPWWRYQGKPATQYWRAPRQKGLVARVNGRRTYWASKAVIPGGTSFENFELEAPFRAGQAFFFGVTPDPPEKLGFRAGWRKNLTGGLGVP